jgi:hypothetical protein
VIDDAQRVWRMQRNAGGSGRMLVPRVGPPTQESTKEPTMSTNPTSTLHRTVRLSVCFLLGAAALTACGEDSPVTSGPVTAQPAATVANAYASPEQADRAAILAVQADVSAEVANRSHDLDLGTALARMAAAEKASAHASADSLERNAVAQKASAHGSADALEHWAQSGSQG